MPQTDPNQNYWRLHIGGMWEEIGQLQFDTLVGHGLQAHHKLLDIGCGSLRGGVHFIRYLDVGHYYGMDKEQWLIDAAQEHELPHYGLLERRPQLIARPDFDFSVFQTKFDYMLAQSVFTHLPWNSIWRCLVNVARHLQPAGQFYATFFRSQLAEDDLSPIEHPNKIVTFPDDDPFHYHLSTFEDLARRAKLRCTYLGDFGHPRDQELLRFTLDPTAK